MCDDFMIFMQTLEAYEKDIFSQTEFIHTFHAKKPLSKTQQKNVIFTGTGDSFVSAMLAEVFSNYLVKSFDPLDLLKNKTITKNKTIYLVSISGNTRGYVTSKSNLLLSSFRFIVFNLLFI